MTDSLSISIAQLDPTVGDITGNLGRLRDAWREAATAGADLVVASELFVAGYPPEDLVLKPMFVASCMAAVSDFAREIKDGPAVLLGSPWHQDGKLYNAIALLAEGQVQALRFKHDLPNYGVFDEKRVFAPGPCPGPVVLKGVRLGVMICEDMWSLDASETLQESGAELLIVVNGSPFESNKVQQRLDLARDRVKETVPAAARRQSDGRPGRAGVRWRVLRADGGGRVARPGAAMEERAGADALDPRGHRLDGGEGRAVGAARSPVVDLSGDGARPQRLCAQNKFSASSSASRAVSIRRSRRRWRSMRWVPIASIA